MNQKQMIPITFRYREEDDGFVVEGLKALQKLEDSRYYGRSISEIVRMIFVPAFKEQVKQRLNGSTVKKLKL